MYIKKIHIDSFGPLRDRELELCNGLNIIEGENESGKSTVAMFIKFMLYGLSGRTSDGEMSERRKYVPWSTGCASGNMTVVTKVGEYRIERELFVFSDAQAVSENVRERVTVTDALTKERVYRDKVPGEALLGIPEQVFVNTVFVRQSGGKIDGSGLAEAIENILMSGDESISTKKAADALEKQRKTLRYKSGRQGGRLYELEREEARLSAKLSEAAEKSAEIINLESSLEKLQAGVEEKEREAQRCAEISEAYEKLSRADKLDNARRCRAEIARIDASLSEYEKYGSLSEAAARIHRLSADIAAAETELREASRREAELDRQLPKEVSEDEAARLRSDVKLAKKASGGAAALRVFGVLFILLGAGIAALAFLLPDLLQSFLSGYYKWAAIGAGALLLILAIIFFAAGAAKAKKFKAILREWDADGADGLSKEVERHIALSRLRDDPSSEYSLAAENLRRAQERKDALVYELRGLCAVYCEENPDTDIFAQNAVSAAEALQREQQSLWQSRREWEGRLAAVSEVLGDDGGASAAAEAAAVLATDAGREARSMGPAEARETAQKARFIRSSLVSLNQQLIEKTARLNQLRGGSPDPYAVAAELDSVRCEKAVLSEKYNAIMCALDALKEAGENLRRSLMPRIVGEAGAIMGNFTDGRYASLGVERNFDMTFETEGKTRDAAYLSAGTSDIAYISLRCALLSILFQNDAPPAVYDESFARVDETRLSRILSLLSAASDRGSQSLVFTCRTLEGNIADKLDGVNVIHLDGKEQ